MKRYIFHYTIQDGDKECFDDELACSYHDSLLSADGQECTAEFEDGDTITEAFFDDGNELSVYVSELELIGERN